MEAANRSGTSTAARPSRVLILGGGYVAVYACRALKRAMRAGQVEVVVVSRANYQAFHGFIGEMVTGRLMPSTILSPARRLYGPARVHVGEIERVDLRDRVVRTSRSIDGARQELRFDQLVVCLGSTDRLEAYPGLAEHAFRLKTYDDCARLRNHIIRMFELADIEPDPDERRRLLTFFVAGGGFAGTEVAGEVSDFATRLTRAEYRGVRRDECRVVLVHPGPTILPELHGDDGSGAQAFPKLVEFAMERMRELGVEVMTATTVDAVTPSEVSLSSGERIPTRTVISAVGTKASAIVERLPLPKEERGRIVTDHTLRVPGHPGIWAGGDNAAVPKPGGGTCPPVAIYAMHHGAQIGRNIARMAAGKRPRRFRFPGLGQAASVGRRSAIGELKGIQFTGLPAWLLWRGFLLYYLPSWDRRLRIVADWAIWPIVGRDIVETGDRGGDYDLRQNVFQPGEIVASEARTGRYVHVIVEGEVEILRELEDGREEVLAVRRQGDNFGSRWTESFDLEFARARTAVRTIAVRRDQAPELQEVLRSAGQLVAESGYFPTITDVPRS